MNYFMEVAKMRAARLLVGEAAAAVQSEEPDRSISLRTHCQTSGWSLTAQDVFNNVDAHLHRSHGGGPRPHPVAPHQRARRGAGAARRTSPPASPATPSSSSSRRVRHRNVHRPLGRQLLRRAPHPRSRAQGVGAHRGGRASSAAWPRRSRQGIPKLPHRGGRRPHPGAHRLRPLRPWSASTSTAWPRTKRRSIS